MLKKKSILLLFLLCSSIVCDLSSTNSIDTDYDLDIKKVNAKKLVKSKKLAKKLNSDKDSVKNERTKSKKLIKDESDVEVTIDATTEANVAVDDSEPQLPVRIRLRRDLLKNYDKIVHPVRDPQSSINVSLGLAYLHLNLDEWSSVLEVDAWLRQRWVDQFLTWDPRDYENLTMIHFALDEVWRPDIKLYNSADSGRIHVFGDEHTQFIVEHTGKVIWVPSAKFRAFCKIELRNWPFETQKCKLKFGSWTTHGAQVGLDLLGNNTEIEEFNFYTRNKEWIVTESKAEHNEVKYPCCDEFYPDITFHFTFHRRSPFYRCGIIMPCLVTMLLVLSSFLLPPNAGEKILVNCTCLIVCVLYLLYFLNSLPALSDQIPLIVLFYSNILALVGIAIVLNICCPGITREKRYTSPPKFLRNIFSGALGKFLCLSNYYNQISFTHQRLSSEMETMSESPESE
jgi:nicotinic acetylcholine receptor